MPAITASMVAELRAKTDAPMMMCKKALTEADGDAVKAEELLRVKLGTKAAGAGSRVTSEGVVASYVAQGVGAMVEVNCETDFVTKNDDFIGFANKMAVLIAEKNPADVAALSALELRPGRLRPDARRRAQGPDRQDWRERLDPTFQALRRHAQARELSARHPYRCAGRSSRATRSAAKDVAMHVAAMKPKSLLQSAHVPDPADRHRAIGRDGQKAAEDAEQGQGRGQDAAVGRHRQAAHRWIGGEVPEGGQRCSNQAFVKNDKQTVEQMLKERSAPRVKGFHAVCRRRRHREEGRRLRGRSGGPGRRSPRPVGLTGRHGGLSRRLRCPGCTSAGPGIRTSDKKRKCTASMAGLQAHPV